MLWISCYGICLIWIHNYYFWSDSGLYYVYFDVKNIRFGYFANKLGCVLKNCVT